MAYWVVGLASVIIGEVVMGRRGVTIGIISAVIGSIIYRYIIALATASHIFPAFALKLVSAVIVAVALSIPAIKHGHRPFKNKKGGAQKMLDIKNAVKVFSPGTPNEHKALNNLSIHLDAGEYVTIVGSNGAGKSTLFNAICGNFLLDSGKIIVNDKT